MNFTDLEFKRIHDGFRPKILRYLRNLVGKDEAEDLTQEVFVKVHQGLKDFRGESQLSTWIYRIATNTAMDKRRNASYKRNTKNLSSRISAQGNQVPIENENIPAGEKSSDLEEMMVQNDMMDCVHSYLDRIPFTYRTVLVMSVFEEMKNKEIAEILHVSLATVKIRLHRGKLRLRKELVAHCGWFLDSRRHIVWDGRRI